MIGFWAFFAAALAVILAIWQPDLLRRRWKLFLSMGVLGFWAHQARSEFGLAVDATTYVAAAERLLTHGDIYTTHPGDRPVLWGTPSVPAPTLYPPTAALVATPLALLGDVGVWLLWAVVSLATLWAIYDAERHGLDLMMVALLPFAAVQVVVGNLNGLIAAAMILAWRHRNSPWAAIAIGILGALKVAPLAALAFWLATRRWAAFAAGIASALVITAVAFLVLGPKPFAEWVTVANSVRPAPISIQAMGLPSTLIVAGGLVALARVRSAERLAFAVSVLLSTFVAPSFNMTTPFVLLAAVAPFGRMTPRERPGTKDGVETTGATNQAFTPNSESAQRRGSRRAR
jgi:hypothetical protein